MAVQGRDRSAAASLPGLDPDIGDPAAAAGDLGAGIDISSAGRTQIVDSDINDLGQAIEWLADDERGRGRDSHL